MSDFLIAPVARMELDQIWEYYAIELQNPDAADRKRQPCHLKSAIGRTVSVLGHKSRVKNCRSILMRPVQNWVKMPLAGGIWSQTTSSCHLFSTLTVRVSV
jgi:hypothetical protein